MTIVEKLGEWKIGVEEDVETFVDKLRQLGQKIEYDEFAKVYYRVGTSIIIYEGWKTLIYFSPLIMNTKTNPIYRRILLCMESKL